MARQRIIGTVGDERKGTPIPQQRAENLNGTGLRIRHTGGGEGGRLKHTPTVSADAKMRACILCSPAPAIYCNSVPIQPCRVYTIGRMAQRAS